MCTRQEGMVTEGVIHSHYDDNDDSNDDDDEVPRRARTKFFHSI